MRLERAKELLDQGEPGRALALLARPVPAALRPEHEFLSAECLRSGGCLTRAAYLYRRLLRRPASDDPALWLESCLGLVSCLRSLGETAEARRMWILGRKTAASVGTRDIREKLDLEGALIDRAAGRYRRSLVKLRRLLARRRRERDWAGAGYVLWAMGGALRFSGDLAGSRRAFWESLALCRRARDAAGAAYALFGLGGVTRIQGRLAEAGRHYACALKAVTGTEDAFGQAYAHCGLANVLRQKGKLREAERHYRLAHRLYRRIGDPVDLAYVDWGLGQIYLRRGELGAAEKRLRLALAAFMRGGETRGIVLSETSWAGLLHARGQAARAESIFARALRRARQAGIHAHLEVFT